ncbi:MAG TPA: VWA domain-containing protein [Candidatus Limnocylindrales bacterium]|nr:VWA domain-containing protein [Candidatus Limnocylindrales bacterium]
MSDPITHRRVDQLLTVRPDRTLIRAHARSERFLLVDVVAPTVAPDPSRRRPPVNLAFVLDRSGSMGGQNKLGLAKQAVVEAIHRLEAEDRFAVVTYDDQLEVVIPSTLASPAERTRAADRLRSVDPRGSTNLHGGWLTGCEQVAGGLAVDGVNRVLLLTDGLANVGITDHAELQRLAGELRDRGITTSTFGVGTDFDESLLQGMADAGGGHFYFIGDVAQMRDHITSEVGETLEVVAREVVLEFVLPHGVRVDALSPFRVESSHGGASVFLGDMVSGQVLSIVLRLTFDFGEVGREVGVALRARDRDGAFAATDPSGAPVTVAWRYADHAANDAQPRDRAVDRVVARLFAERARQEAVALNRQGRYGDATKVIEGVRRRVAAYAGSDPELQAVVAHLAEEKPAYAAAMPEMQRKQAHYAASMNLRSRSVDGRSQRRS